LTATVAAFGCASVALAGTIVIRSSGPSAKTFPAGKPLSDGQKIVLKSGDMLVVLDSRGTRTLSGAGSFTVGASASGTAAPSTFAALIGNPGTRQVRTGAVRGTNTAQPRVASLWYLDTAKSGTVCLRDLSRATLWRASMTLPVTYTLTRVSDGKSVPVAFSAGQAVRSWPVADMPLVADADYRIAGPGLEKPTALRVTQIAGTTDAADEVAATLIGKGCTGQLDTLVEAGKAQPVTG
jgi:hypothetical protein